MSSIFSALARWYLLNSVLACMYVVYLTVVCHNLNFLLVCWLAYNICKVLLILATLVTIIRCLVWMMLYNLKVYQRPRIVRSTVNRGRTYRHTKHFHWSSASFSLSMILSSAYLVHLRYTCRCRFENTSLFLRRIPNCASCSYRSITAAKINALDADSKSMTNSINRIAINNKDWRMKTTYGKASPKNECTADIQKEVSSEKKRHDCC